MGGVLQASWQAEPWAAGRTGRQLTPLLAPDLPRLSWAPSPARCPVPPGAVPPLSSQPDSFPLPPIPPPQANHVPGTSEKGRSFQSCSEQDAFPRASWSVSRRPGLRGDPDLRPALSPPPQSGWGVVLRPSPSPRPGHLSLFFRVSPSSAPFSLIATTHVQSPAPRPLPPSLFPFPELAALALEFTTAKTHTHTHAQNQLWNVFPLPSGGLWLQRALS